MDWDYDFSIFVSLALLRRLPDCPITAEFLALILESPLIADQILKRSKQGTVKNLHLEEIRDFNVPVPSIEEQAVIVEATQSLTRRLDEARLQLGQWELLKKSLMQDLLTGKVRVAV